jgi:hypothetical protein
MTEAWIKDMMAEACKTKVENLVEHFEEKLQSLADTYEHSVGNGRLTRRRINAPPTQDSSVL